MLEIAAEVLDALADGRRLAVACVTDVLGSAPRTAGTAMAVDEAGRVIGSISGGCVEGAVVEVAAGVLDDGVPVLTGFGVSDDDAFQVGLTCGGRIGVVIVEVAPAGDHRAPVPAAVRAALEDARASRPASLALVLDGPAVGTWITADADPVSDAAVGADSARRIRAELAARLAAGRSGTTAVHCADGPTRVLHLVAAAPPRLLVFGAVDFSAALADAAVLLGYRVTVCDARPAFATPARFPSAHEVVAEWPDEYLARTEVDARTVICVLTHDDRFDVPLLVTALRLPVAFVGAMGSRATHERRRARLVEEGLTDVELARLRSPIGLDLGASTPQETAVSILAEVLAARAGTAGAPLTTTRGPIHGETS
ncbi:XshC-Cox1-family protein [Clavibacter michiganensis]|uniref:XdhC family protein n=1 Tax=Clavibacter michiganensis TaxID=28447 RepID=UPI000CE7A733|nr:XdhC/CoxI family protein [Clavibacter michiganensis]PPF54957.1 XshC-Cox1-family protein [Clavibacter michiganensis]